MKEKASVTVTMTLVLFMVLSLMLVTLEHDYVVCGRTLALQVFDKSLESVLGCYYAPLFSDYGLLGVPVGDGFLLKDSEEIEAGIEQNFNHVFKDGSLWNMTLSDTELNGKITLVSDNGGRFVSQIKEEVLYEGVLSLGEELLKLSEGEPSAFDGLFSGAEEESDEDSKEEEPEAGVKEIIDTLKTFLKEGLSGLWFEDTSGISTKRLDVSDLPSRTEGGYDTEDEDELFVLPEFDDMLIDSGDYLEEMTDGNPWESFLEKGSELADSLSDRAALVAYAGMYMDNYVKNDYKAGALNYEQEYLIFGTPSDNLNVRRAASAIFGIRFCSSLFYLATDAERQEELDSWLGAFNMSEKIRLLVKTLAVVVWAVQNALVETAAILKEKSVDFIVSAGSLQVELDEILSMSKVRIMYRASHYKGGSGIKLKYENYLSVFMLFIDKEKLSYRMMDIIEMNMRKNYEENFRLRNTLIGFSCSGKVGYGQKYLSLTFFDRAGTGYACDIVSSVGLR